MARSKRSSASRPAEGLHEEYSLPEAGNERNPSDTPRQVEGRRAGDLPEILIVEDLAVILKIGLPAARALVRSGACGPFSRLGRRMVLRRDSFLATLEASEERHTPLASGHPSHTQRTVVSADANLGKEGGGPAEGRLRYRQKPRGRLLEGDA